VAFTERFGRKPRPASGFETGFGTFYHTVLLQGVLTMETEKSLLDYYLIKPDGIYYIYDKPLNKLPEVFTSIKSSRYLAAIEILARYMTAKDKLGFVADWLLAHQDSGGQWDFGVKANDGIYFPLSDSWRKTEDRKYDCTARVNRLLEMINGK